MGALSFEQTTVFSHAMAVLLANKTQQAQRSHSSCLSEFKHREKIHRAWFEDIRHHMGADTAEEMNGVLFSRDKSPRANIFRNSAPQVLTLEDMKAEMQRNRWPDEIDGGSRNSPDHAIAARSDLDRRSPVPNGAVDSKVTNLELMKTLSCQAISGPTRDAGKKPFQWISDDGKDLFPSYPHEGLPNKWNFDWVTMEDA